jgi:hypothetical protein
MKNFILNAQFISLGILGFLTLLILGAEPGTSEQSMYDYEHFTDPGNLGWYICWGWVIMLVSFLTLTGIRFYKKIN